MHLFASFLCANNYFPPPSRMNQFRPPSLLLTLLRVFCRCQAVRKQVRPSLTRPLRCGISKLWKLLAYQSSKAEICVFGRCTGSCEWVLHCMLMVIAQSFCAISPYKLLLLFFFFKKQSENVLLLELVRAEFSMQ